MVIGGDSAGGQISSLLATKPAFLKARGMSTPSDRGVLALDAVGYDVAADDDAGHRRINSGFQRMMFNAFGTPAEEEESPLGGRPVNFAGRTDLPIFSWSRPPAGPLGGCPRDGQKAGPATGPRLPPGQRPNMPASCRFSAIRPVTWESPHR